MITLLQNGAWLLNGQEIVEDTADSVAAVSYTHLTLPTN